MGKVIMSGVSKGMTEPVAFTAPANFVEATWDQIAEACERNMVPESWEVGDQKTMTINGTDYLIDIIGKNHDTYAAGGTAPLTLQLHQCYSVTSGIKLEQGSNNWGACDLRVSFLQTILSTWMPSEVRSRVKEVNKLTSGGDTSSTIATTADKLFLLSEVEVFGNAEYSFAGEGRQYAYYTAGNSKVKTLSGSATGWWLRSPYKSNAAYSCSVTDGGIAKHASVVNANGVSFAFCF